MVGGWRVILNEFKKTAANASLEKVDTKGAFILLRT